LIGSAKIENIEDFKNRKKALELSVKDTKGKETGKIEVEVEWESKGLDDGAEEDVRINDNNYNFNSHFILFFYYFILLGI
jgi:hypothetical protein